MKGYIIPDCDFNAVIARGFGRDGAGTGVSNECSPEITDFDFVGIVLNAPKEIIFTTTNTKNNENALPVYGIHSHDLGTPIEGTDDLTNSVVFVVMDTKTNIAWSGTIPEMQNRIPRPPRLDGKTRKLTPEEMKGRILRGYFNPNLFNITNMPLHETEYIVYATVGPYKSNVLTIKAIEGK